MDGWSSMKHALCQDYKIIKEYKTLSGSFQYDSWEFDGNAVSQSLLTIAIEAIKKVEIPSLEFDYASKGLCSLVSFLPPSSYKPAILYFEDMIQKLMDNEITGVSNFSFIKLLVFLNNVVNEYYLIAINLSHIIFNLIISINDINESSIENYLQSYCWLITDFSIELIELIMNDIKRLIEYLVGSVFFESLINLIRSVYETLIKNEILSQSFLCFCKDIIDREHNEHLSDIWDKNLDKFQENVQIEEVHMHHREWARNTGQRVIFLWEMFEWSFDSNHEIPGQYSIHFRNRLGLQPYERYSYIPYWNPLEKRRKERKKKSNRQLRALSIYKEERAEGYI